LPRTAGASKTALKFGLPRGACPRVGPRGPIPSGPRLLPRFLPIPRQKTLLVSLVRHDLSDGRRKIRAAGRPEPDGKRRGRALRISPTPAVAPAFHAQRRQAGVAGVRRQPTWTSCATRTWRNRLGRHGPISPVRARRLTHAAACARAPCQTSAPPPQSTRRGIELGHQPTKQRIAPPPPSLAAPTLFAPKARTRRTRSGLKLSEQLLRSKASARPTSTTRKRPVRLRPP